MDKREAYKLLDSIELAMKTGAARVHQLDAPYGEHVVILRKGGYFLWSFDDWYAYCETEGISLLYVSKSLPSDSYINATRPDEIYQLAV